MWVARGMVGDGREEVGEVVAVVVGDGGVGEGGDR